MYSRYLVMKVLNLLFASDIVPNFANVFTVDAKMNVFAQGRASLKTLVVSKLEPVADSGKPRV